MGALSPVHVFGVLNVLKIFTKTEYEMSEMLVFFEEEEEEEERVCRQSMYRFDGNYACEQYVCGFWGLSLNECQSYR